MDLSTTGPRVIVSPSANLSRCLTCLLLLISAACQPLTATMLPTPEIVQIQYTPALSSWTASLNRCASSLPQIGLVTYETPADRLDPARVDFALRFGPQPDPTQGTPFPFFVAVLSTDEIVLAVNATNPVVSLTPPIIRAIFSGQVTHWNDLDSQKVTPQPTDTGLAIQVWSYPPGDDVRLVFDKAFMQGNPPASQTYLAPDTSAMLEALTHNPGAVGYLLKSQLNLDVRMVTINGNPSLNLTQPILALSLKEPQGYARQLLVCLQGK